MTIREDAFSIWYITADWDQLDELLEQPLSDDDKELLKQCLENNAKTVIVEREYIDKDYRNVYSNHYSKKFSRLPSRTTRLHVFDVELKLEDILPIEDDGCTLAERLGQKFDLKGGVKSYDTTPGYIGSIVVRPTEYSTIGRCLLDPRKLYNFGDRSSACLATFPIQLMGHSLQVNAFPHQSQDAEVHTCAHTAAWGLFRYLSQRYPQYRELYPFDVAMLNKDLSRGRPIPGRGLYMDQVCAIMGEFGIGAEMYYISKEEPGQLLELFPTSSDKWSDIDWHDESDILLQLLQCHIESGMPAIVGVPEHAVVAFGVKYSAKRMVSRSGQLVPSTDYLSDVIVNDDNFAPYRLYNRNLKSDEPMSPTHHCGEIDALVVPIADKVFLTADKIEHMVPDTLAQLGPPNHPSGNWPNSDPNAPYVRHVFCTSSKNYKNWRLRDQDRYAHLIARQPLPHFLWVVEIYPESYWLLPERKAVAEIAFDATAGRFDSAPFLWIRYPEGLLVNWGRLYGDDSSEISWDPIEDDESLTFLGFQANLKGLS